jgi:hypothetical protein
VFGRRKVAFGEAPAAPPPIGKEPLPVDKMDDALLAAIRLFTRVLDEAGVDAGGLAMRGDVPPNVTRMLADCVTYRGEDDGGITYLTLGITEDFKAFMYPPHCRLYFIINSTGICEDKHTQSFLKSLAPEQLPSPLVDAHMMRQWVRYILPTGQAMKEGPEALRALHGRLMEDLLSVIRRVPPAFENKMDLKSVWSEWASGFPGAIGRPLTADVQRMNGLPVTPFIADTLTKVLAELQMRGLQNR